MDGLGDPAQVVVHDHHVRRLHGGIGSGAAHGETDVGARQCRRVVDAVARHGDEAIALLQLFDGRELVFGEQVAASVIDASLLGDGLCGRNVVAGEHDRSNTEGMELLQCLARALLDGVCHRKDREHLAAGRQHGDRATLRLMNRQARFDPRAAQATVLDQAMVAQDQLQPIGAGFDATTRQGRKPFKLPVALEPQPGRDRL